MPEHCYLSDDLLTETQKIYKAFWRSEPRRDRLTCKGVPRQREERGGSSLKDVAAALGLSTQRVQQIERSALEKLRLHCAERGIRLSDLIHTG